MWSTQGGRDAVRKVSINYSRSLVCGFQRNCWINWLTICFWLCTEVTIADTSRQKVRLTWSSKMPTGIPWPTSRCFRLKTTGRHYTKCTCKFGRKSNILRMKAKKHVVLRVVKGLFFDVIPWYSENKYKNYILNVTLKNKMLIMTLRNLDIYMIRAKLSQAELWRMLLNA